MDTIVVHNPKALRAAISAMACRTADEAAKAPFVVRFETCIYTFGAGVTEARARAVGKNIAATYGLRKKHRKAGS